MSSVALYKAYTWRNKSINVTAPRLLHDIIKMEFAGLVTTQTTFTPPILEFVLDRPHTLPELAHTHMGFHQFLQGQDTTLFSSYPRQTVTVYSPVPNRLVVKLLLTIVFKQLHISDMLFFEATTVILPNGDTAMVVGPGGSGKSSLALAVVERGGKLISDDITPIGLSNGKTSAFPLLKRIDIPTGPQQWQPHDVLETQRVHPSKSYNLQHIFLLDGPANISFSGKRNTVAVETYCSSLYDDPFDWRSGKNDAFPLNSIADFS